MEPCVRGSPRNLASALRSRAGGATFRARPGRCWSHSADRISPSLPCRPSSAGSRCRRFDRGPRCGERGRAQAAAQRPARNLSRQNQAGVPVPLGPAPSAEVLVVEANGAGAGRSCRQRRRWEPRLPKVVPGRGMPGRHTKVKRRVRPDPRAHARPAPMTGPVGRARWARTCRLLLEHGSERCPRDALHEYHRKRVPRWHGQFRRRRPRPQALARRTSSAAQARRWRRR